MVKLCTDGDVLIFKSGRFRVIKFCLIYSFTRLQYLNVTHALLHWLV